MPGGKSGQFFYTFANTFKTLTAKKEKIGFSGEIRLSYCDLVQKKALIRLDNFDPIAPKIFSTREFSTHEFVKLQLPTAVNMFC